MEENFCELPGPVDIPDPAPIHQEWLVTNGLGGYASGTVTGAITRRYHGLLVAALPNPKGRTMMLNGLSERVRLPNRQVMFTGAEELICNQPGKLQPPTSFRLEDGLPVWRYELDGYVLEKRLFMPYRQNTTHVTYHMLEGEGPLRLNLRTAIRMRPHDEPVDLMQDAKYRLSVYEDQFDIIPLDKCMPILRMFLHGPSTSFSFDRRETSIIPYSAERERGYAWRGSLWSPGYFRTDLEKGQRTTLVFSIEDWDTLRAMSPEASMQAEIERRKVLIGAAVPELRSEPASRLVLAADQFIFTPAGRLQEAQHLKESGAELRTIIAGYHWFTDWGRDTMISLEGLALVTGRRKEAGWILKTFGEYVRNGLIPNMFPEREQDGLYHTADATLWFFHAIHRYMLLTKDRDTLRHMLPKFKDIIEHHMKGTLFGIRMDPQDGLLIQGKEGYQLTWMDAKVEDWVVTPRRGKAVEINALWYNALRLLERWLLENDDHEGAHPMGQLADKVRQSFNKRFWFEKGGYLYDVVDAEQGGNDDACRPNQLFAVSLDNPVLDEARWQQVLDVATQKLLTPVGLRSLSPDHPEYKEKYYGDLRSRDAAYHQGTVWGWLIGPYIDAFLRVNPGRKAEARELLSGLIKHLDEACMGSISEVFDAEEPFLPRGCIAQAWSVAEVLRCWVKAS